MSVYNIRAGVSSFTNGEVEPPLKPKQSVLVTPFNSGPNLPNRDMALRSAQSPVLSEAGPIKDHFFFYWAVNFSNFEFIFIFWLLTTIGVERFLLFNDFRWTCNWVMFDVVLVPWIIIVLWLVFWEVRWSDSTIFGKHFTFSLLVQNSYYTSQIAVMTIPLFSCKLFPHCHEQTHRLRQHLREPHGRWPPRAFSPQPPPSPADPTPSSCLPPWPALAEVLEMSV